MKEKSSWEKFFDDHAPVYEENVFTKNTQCEVDFLLEELQLRPGQTVLDVGCGTGRHAVELARRGYAVTGLDLSAEMLEKAAASARLANISLKLVRADATQFTFDSSFDAAICLCEGSFGLLGAESSPIDHPLAILSNISRSLKPGAKTVFTVLNGGAIIRRYQNSDVLAGRFDFANLCEINQMAPREGMLPVKLRERGFVPTELMLLFRVAGLSVVNIWGGTAGNWGRRPIDLDEIEIMLAAQKFRDPVSIL